MRTFEKRKLRELQDKLYASKTNGVLILFQGMDCSGKDGVIKKVLSNLNPQGFRAESFKKPTPVESSQDIERIIGINEDLKDEICVMQESF